MCAAMRRIWSRNHRWPGSSARRGLQYIASVMVCSGAGGSTRRLPAGSCNCLPSRSRTRLIRSVPDSMNGASNELCVLSSTRGEMPSASN
ncbi:MAG: hypothetical protein JWR82_2679 [Blastococcus sp.]|nr:hypothetical protein [Blastococcus sp.]